MDLATMMALRPVAGAGLLVTLTRRCPLSCAHCSTASDLTSEQLDGASLLRFVSSFSERSAPTSEHRSEERARSGASPSDERLREERSAPKVALFTGGEPMLRPDLVGDLTAAAQAAGCAAAVLTGGFFVRGGTIPDRIRHALLDLDHISFSLDAFHEREVERTDVFAALRTLLDAGKDVSLHLIGTGDDDPYLADLTAAVTGRFGADVPMLVSTLRTVGRAAAWAAGRPVQVADHRPLPCSLAAWPVVTFDGVVTACCNQRVVDGRPVPAHLRLGDIAVDDWATVRDRLLSSATLRTIRSVGPLNLLRRFDPGTADTGGGYCGACRSLGDRADVLDAVDRAAGGPVGELLDREIGLLQQRAGAAALLRRYASSHYADLIGTS